MTITTAKNLVEVLLQQGAKIDIFQREDGEWVVSATKPGGKVTSGQLSALASSFSVVAQTDRAEFI
jgi:hypothetical protein